MKSKRAVWLRYALWAIGAINLAVFLVVVLPKMLYAIGILTSFHISQTPPSLR